MKSRRPFRSLSIAPTALVLAAVTFAPVAVHAGPTFQDDQAEKIREAIKTLGDRSREAAQPLPAGQQRVLEAVVMQVTGRAQWRADETARWAAAKVDDVLPAGAMIRTGLRSRVVLRVGHNATILVDRNTRVSLPEIAQDGETLRTTATLRRGRADFKVDRVGLTNDFSVITPSTTLAVRGTGYGVQYGGFNGTEVFAARTNAMFAIEIQYFLSRFSYYLSGGATSTEQNRNPAIASLFRTYGPPKILSGLVEDGLDPNILDSSFERTGVVDQRAVDLLNQTNEDLQELLMMDDPDPDPDPDDPLDGLPLPGLDEGQTAQYICVRLFQIFVRYDEAMNDSFGGPDGRGGFTFPGLDQVFFDIDTICSEAGTFDDEVFTDITNRIVAYCEGQFTQQSDVDVCVGNFVESVVQDFHRP
jgi:hypothetical protein